MSVLGIGVCKDIPLQSVRIRGLNYALFKTSSGRLAMVDAVCPHRGANLCNGRVSGDEIACPYHGWRFDEGGNLTSVPSCDFIPLGCSLDTVDVVENGGFVWTSSSSSDLPTHHCKELFDPRWVQIYGSLDLDGNIYDWILNATDVSHINYVHNFADETNGEIRDLRISSGDDYVDCHALVNPKASSVATEHMQPVGGAPIHSRFIAPATSVVRIKLAGEYEFVTFSTLCPIDDSHTKMSWCMMYPSSPIMNNIVVKSRFRKRMVETIRQDEAIIRETSSVPLNFNVPCDVFQLKTLRLLEGLWS